MRAADRWPGYTYVDAAATLRAVCERLAKTERFALDTEFVGERTYLPVLELIQVATPDETALIDCRAVPSLEPFFKVLADAKIEKVLHAGQQDLELFYSLTGRAPSPIIDTQVAAALAGYGAQVGYAQLVERLLDVAVEKSETLTDWSRRPLTKAQLAYAVDDVRHLLGVYEKLRAKLTGLERWDWLGEECRRLERSVRSLPVEPEEAWLRVRGRGTLRAKGLVVLRALADWREQFARERNKPRASIARDEALVEIARKAPTTVEGLRGLRAVRSRELERHAGDVVQRIARALETPREEWPQPPPQQSAAPSTGCRRAAASGAAAARRRGRHRAEPARDARRSAGLGAASRQRRRARCADHAGLAQVDCRQRSAGAARRAAPRSRSIPPAVRCG